VTRKPVTRLGRKLDIVSLIFVAVGVVLFVGAFLGMAELRDLPETEFVPGTIEAYAALNRYFRLQTLSRLGIGIAVAGVLIGLSAAWHNRKFREAGADPSLRSG
jgi:hypothetical protein